MKKRRWLWLMLYSFPAVLLFSFVLGLAVGYSVLGKSPLEEVFDWATWKHVWDLVFAP